MSFAPEFIRGEVENQAYLISIHADDERLADGFTITELEAALINCEVIEQYPEDPCGESCLASGLDHCLHPIPAQMERPIYT